MTQNTNHWENIGVSQTPGTAQVDERFWDSLHPGDVVLEVGSGNGRILEQCLGKGYSVVGVDINENEIRNLQRIHDGDDRVTVMLADVTQPFTLPEKVDGVVMLGLLGALGNPDMRADALRNTVAVTKIGGELAVAEFLYDGDDEVLLKRYAEGKGLGLEDGSFAVYDDKHEIQYITHNFRETELTELIGRAAHILSVEKRIFMSYHGNQRKGVMIRAEVR